MVWWKPWTWFAKNANSYQKLAQTQALKNALKNYINAYKALPLNGRERQNIQALLNKAGANGISYKNRLATAIAGVVNTTYKANSMVQNAVITGAPEGPAAAAVNNAANKIKNLNNFMSGFTGGNANALAKYYTNSGRNYKTNRALNSGRNGGARYASLWNDLNRRAAVTNFAELPGTNNGANTQNLLKAVLNKTTNTKLQAEVNTRDKATKLRANLLAAATAAGLNIKNPNVGAAISRINAHESRLPPPSAPVLSNKNRLRAVLNKTNETRLMANVKNSSQANALMTEIRNSARTAGVNLRNKNVSEALGRVGRHKTALMKAPNKPNVRKGQVGGAPRNVYYHRNGRNGYYIKRNNGFYSQLPEGNANVGTWQNPINTRVYQYNSNNGFTQRGTPTN